MAGLMKSGEVQKPPVRILVVDPVSYSLSCTRDLLKLGLPGASVSAALGEQDVLSCSASYRPDVVIFDVDRLAWEVPTFVAHIKRTFPGARTLAMLSRLSPYYVYVLRKSTPDFVLLKRAFTSECLVSYVKAIMTGESLTYWRPAHELLSRAIPDPSGWGAKLSNREIQLLGGIGAGSSNAQLGEQFGLSPNTVKNHRARIKVKLDITSDAELRQFAIEQGFTKPGLYMGLTSATTRNSEPCISSLPKMRPGSPAKRRALVAKSLAARPTTSP